MFNLAVNPTFTTPLERDIYLNVGRFFFLPLPVYSIYSALPLSRSCPYQYAVCLCYYYRIPLTAIARA